MFLAAYPEIREGLPVYLRWVGMDYPQESETCRRGDGEESLLLFSMQGTGEVVIDGNVCVLPEGSAAYISGRVDCRYRPKDREWGIGCVTFGCGIPRVRRCCFSDVHGTGLKKTGGTSTGGCCGSCTTP